MVYGCPLGMRKGGLQINALIVECRVHARSSHSIWFDASAWNISHTLAAQGSTHLSRAYGQPVTPMLQSSLELRHYVPIMFSDILWVIHDGAGSLQSDKNREAVSRF